MNDDDDILCFVSFSSVFLDVSFVYIRSSPEVIYMGFRTLHLASTLYTRGTPGQNNTLRTNCLPGVLCDVDCQQYMDLQSKHYQNLGGLSWKQ